MAAMAAVAMRDKRRRQDQRRQELKAKAGSDDDNASSISVAGSKTNVKGPEWHHPKTKEELLNEVRPKTWRVEKKDILIMPESDACPAVASSRSRVIAHTDKFGRFSVLLRSISSLALPVLCV